MQEEQTQESSQEPAPVEARPGKRSKASKKRTAVESQPEEEQPQAEPETQEATPQADEATPVEQKPQAAPAATETDGQAGAARDLFTQGIQSLLHGEYDASENQLGQALTIWQKLGDRAGQIEVLEQLGHLASMRGETQSAQEYYRQASVLRRA
jgi:outer membrane biosynthesis protein TonB